MSFLRRIGSFLYAFASDVAHNAQRIFEIREFCKLSMRATEKRNEDGRRREED